MREAVLSDLREIDYRKATHDVITEANKGALSDFLESGVKFASTNDALNQLYAKGLRELLGCIHSPHGRPILYEGGVYQGCWIESTGTINAELLQRFCPSVSKSTYETFAEFQREDGLLPFRVMPEGPDYMHLQIVTPLARSVWNYYLLQGKNNGFLERMYQTMGKFDAWVARYRNTRGTGAVEAFCVWDTGHDMSPRFWHVPDATPSGNAASYCADYPLLPFVAPDLTANIYCQRKYMSLMAKELGEDGEDWAKKAEETKKSLYRHCFDEQDQFFYDLANTGEFVRVQSDVLLRVLACEATDPAFFESSLRRYLLHTRKFFSRYPFTSIAMDDPRFEPRFEYNNWSGTANFLTLIRAPHAFEYFGHYVELSWVMQAIVYGLSRFTEFPQGINPWNGHQGFTTSYTPAILCLIDYIERLCGILPATDSTVWFTNLTLLQYESVAFGDQCYAYSRRIDGSLYEMVSVEAGSAVYKEGSPWCEFPRGIRVVTDREGSLLSIIGMTVRPVKGEIHFAGQTYPFEVKGNEVLQFENGGFRSARSVKIVMPAT